MNQHRSATIIFCWITWSLATAAHAVPYTATILFPAGYNNISVATAVDGGAIAAYGSGTATGNKVHALLSNGVSFVDLNPSGFKSQALDVSENYQVGNASPAASSNEHAYLWSGTAASGVDLNPSGYAISNALGVWGNVQVGYGQLSPPPAGQQNRALLWNGTAASFVELHPAGFDRTEAYKVYDNSQVGQGIGSVTGNAFHALLWHGSAGSVVDLNPPGATRSQAIDVFGGVQVGNATVGGVGQGIVWTGTAESAVSLHPSGFTSSSIESVFENYQVGTGRWAATNQSHALLWNGTAESVVDLHQYLTGLPVTFTGSDALGISSNGNIVGLAFDASANVYAILWSPVPEPGTWLLLAAGGVGAAAFRPFRRRKHERA